MHLNCVRCSCGVASELHGGTGNDRLNGDGGNDTLWGDTGADTFEFDTRYVVKAVNGLNFAITPGGDVIKDFRPWEGDRLDLNGQAYTVADHSAGYLITTAHGLILLEGIHSFTSDWVVL